MTEELDAIFFDAGGVLWDMRPSVADLFAAELSDRGVEVDRPLLEDAVRTADRLLDERFAELKGGDEEAFWEEYDDVVLDRLGADVARGGFANAMSARMREVANRAESWVPFPDTVPTLRAVRGRDFKVGLISNATGLARRVLGNLDMERFFDTVVISDEVGVRKPDPRIFRLGLQRVGASPSRTVYIGDRPATDMMGAVGAGMNAILLDRHGTFPGSRFFAMRGLDEVRRRM